MCHFYGWKPREYDKTPVDVVEMFWQAITPIEGQKMLIDFKVSDWPHMKKASRESVGRDIHKQAYPRSFNKPKTITVEEMAKLLNE